MTDTEELAQLLRAAWHKGDESWMDLASIAIRWNRRAPTALPADGGGGGGSAQSQPCGDGAQPILPPVSEPSGEEFIEFKEALSDLRSLRHEHDCLNGGGPGWSARNRAAWDRVDELFANEDEAAWCRQQEDAYG